MASACAIVPVVLSGTPRRKGAHMAGLPGVAIQALRVAVHHPVGANRDRCVAPLTTNACALLGPAGTDQSAAEGLPEVANQALRVAVHHPAGASQDRFAAPLTTNASVPRGPAGTDPSVRK